MPSYIGKATDAFFDAINTGSSIVKDYTENEARFATTTKKYNLQADINNEMQKIAMNGNYTTWQTDINNFFEKVKGQMSDPNSQYYCKNNLQAKMFNEVLNDSLVSVGNRVSMMVMQKQLSQMGVDRDQAINRLIEQGITGNDFVQKANEIDEAYWMLNGNVDPDEKQAVREKRYIYGYTSEREALFDNTLKDAIKRGESVESLINMVKKNASPINATNADGSPMAMDTKGIDADLDKKWYQKYDAALKDYQSENANKLSRILEQMRQVNTAEEKVQIAQHGQNTMKIMKDHDLSESDRNFYSAAFELALGGDGLKGSKSGSGVKKSDLDSFDKLMTGRADLALQLAEEGLNGNMYDVTDRLAQEYVKQFFSKPWQENFNKTEKEAQETFDFRYAGKVSQIGLIDAVMDKMLAKYPEIKEKLGTSFANLRKDMQKNPKQYGTDNVEKMGYWLLDAVFTADPKTTTSKDILEQWDKYRSDCYLDRVKYIELKNINDPTSLVKKFDATKPDQIAQAARLANDKDYVFTWQGKEYWADGKKEALEAPGGVINVLQNGLVGTLDIPQSDVEAGKVGFKYKQTEYDMTSQPVFTYNGHEYEVIPNEKNKGFKVQEYTVDEKGNRQLVREIDGKAGNNTQNRLSAKGKAADTVKDAHNTTTEIEQKRADEVNTIIDNTGTIPNAMRKAGGVKDIEWETADRSTRQIYLQDTVNKIDKDADAVKSNNMTVEEFKGKYGIDYNQWIGSTVKTTRFALILKS